MPYKFEYNKIKLPKGKDARIKLDDTERLQIKNAYKRGVPIREIARQFEKLCSRRLIQFIIFPERLKACNYSGHWKKYYNKDKNREYMKKYRQRKQKILNSH
jgi:IS30 family transposase